MSFTDLVTFAFGALRGHRLRTGLSLLGVAIGVAAVIMLTSLAEGARLFVTQEFQSLGTNLLIILPGKTETTGSLPVVGGVAHDLTLEDLEAIKRRVPAVRYAAPIVTGTVQAETEGRTRDVIIAGTTWEMLPVRKVPIIMGQYLPRGQSDRPPHVCVLGYDAWKELFPKENPLGRFVRVGTERFQIIGVAGPRGITVGLRLDDLIHVPAAHALRMFNRRGVFRALLEVRSEAEILPAKSRIIEVIRERHAGEDDVTILTQDAVLAGFGKILGVLTAALVGITAISLTVAGIGVMNVMLVSVSERVREIGLLKALGATTGQVLRAFLAEASILSTLGGVAGLVAGFLAVRTLRVFYPAFPAEPPPWAIWGALGVSLAVGIVFGLLPARRASRLDPVAALSGR
ncbi:MAG: ABC transporter permease [Thermoanaerobaculia bacterium]|nr:ABC transporter permease [Thermoanaerobaculia bacterium]